MPTQVAPWRRVFVSPLYFAGLTVLLVVSSVLLWTNRPLGTADLIAGSLCGWAALGTAAATVQRLRQRQRERRPPAGQPGDDGR